GGRLLGLLADLRKLFQLVHEGVQRGELLVDVGLVLRVVAQLVGEGGDLDPGEVDDAADDAEGQDGGEGDAAGAAQAVPFEAQHQGGQDEGEQDRQGQGDEDDLAPVEDGGDKNEGTGGVVSALQRRGSGRGGHARSPEGGSE